MQDFMEYIQFIWKGLDDPNQRRKDGLTIEKEITRWTCTEDKRSIKLKWISTLNRDQRLGNIMQEINSSQELWKETWGRKFVESHFWEKSWRWIHNPQSNCGKGCCGRMIAKVSFWKIGNCIPATRNCRKNLVQRFLWKGNCERKENYRKVVAETQLPKLRIGKLLCGIHFTEH